jgi:hypothetical protein
MASDEPAKFAYVLIGSKESPLKVMVNCACGPESVCDFARAALLKQVDTRIAEETLAKTVVWPAAAAAAAPGSEEDGDASAAPEEDADPPVDMVRVFTALREKLTSTDTKLTDEAGAVAVGVEDKLEARTNYSMALFGFSEPVEEGAQPEATITPLLT